MSAPVLLSQDDIQARINNARVEGVIVGGASAPPTGGHPFRFVRPLSEAADSLIDYVTNPEGRYRLGFHDIDLMLRGLGRKEFAIITGMTHSGKSQILLNAFSNNRDVPTLFFTPDETSELVLAKLVSISRGLSAEVVEAAIMAGDQATIDMVKRVAAQDFAKLVVVDESLGWGDMTTALHEAAELLGEPIQFCAFDYLELFGGDEPEAVSASAKRMKAWVHDHDVFGVCVHQSKTRSGAKRGQAAGMEGMRYGGEQEAMYVLEVFRKREDEQAEEWERQRHANTVTVNVAKNKRPPCKRGMCDLFMDPDTGYVRELRDGDVISSYQAQPAVGEPIQANLGGHRLTAYEIMQQQASQLPGVEVA